VSEASLNPPQREAVEHVAGPLLVFAGAGSGKTRVITLRAARLVLTEGVEPQRILLVTFTNKAATEMKQRLALLLGESRVKRMWVGTFHATCARILRQHADAVGRRRDFVIYDDSDQETVMKQIFGEMKIDKKTLSPAKMLQRIQDAKQKAYAPGDIPILDGETAQLVEVWDRYDGWLRACNAMDFEDLILLTMRLAEGSHPAIGSMLRTAFDHVLVDEFQDTNFTQYRLVKALARAGNNLCVVGDDDQCIYTWRGADPSNIRDFQTEWPDAKVVRLEQNYRSSQRIVSCAVGVIEKNKLRAAKTLWTDNAVGSDVEVVESPSDRGEAAFVCGRIRAYLGQGGHARDVAVLYRSHTQSRAIEDQLRDWQVPYRIVGGHRFYDRKEVKDVVGYLRLLSNPFSDVDLLRVINVPARGLGAGTLKRLSEIASSRKMSLWDAVPIAEQAPEIRRSEQLQLGAFRDVIEQFQKTMKTERPSELTARLIAAIGYKKMLEASVKKLVKDGKNAEALTEEARIENLDEIVNAVASYEKRASEEGDVPSLTGYLQLVSLVAEESKDEKANRVLLMTVHASKGLEFEMVFIVGFEEGRFPTRNVDMNPRELEEERRIAYVAITRARTHLIVSLSRLRWVHGQTESCIPSRFLADMTGASRGGAGPERAPAPRNNKDGWL